MDNVVGAKHVSLTLVQEAQGWAQSHAPCHKHPLFGVGKQKCPDVICCDVILLGCCIPWFRHTVCTPGVVKISRANQAMDSSSVSRHAGTVPQK